jgi:hypothetical protein
MESPFITNNRDLPTDAAYVFADNSYTTKITSCEPHHHNISTFIVRGMPLSRTSTICRFLQWGSFPNISHDLAWSLDEHTHKSKWSL